MDDLDPGLLVTIHSPRRTGPPCRSRDLFEFDTEHPQPPFPVVPGSPLRIHALSLPFAVCSVIGPGQAVGGPLILDLRTVRLCRVSEEYVAAITSYGADGERGDDAGSLAPPACGETVSPESVD